MQKERLGDFVKRVRESKNLSLEDVRVKSRGQLATSYVNRIENNQVSADVISVGKLNALAKGIEEPVMSLFNIAIGVTNGRRHAEAEILDIVRELPAGRQADVLRMAKMFFSEEKEKERSTAALTADSGLSMKPQDVVIRAGSIGEIQDELQSSKVPHRAQKRRKRPRKAVK